MSNECEQDSPWSEFVYAVIDITLQLSLGNIDNRKAAGRALRKRRAELWANATDADLESYAQYLSGNKETPLYTYRKALKLARTAQRKNRDLLASKRRW